MAWLHTVERKQLIPGSSGSIVVDPFGPVGRSNLEGMLFPDGTYSNYAVNGFGRNELVYACIMKKARTLPQAVLRVYGEGQAEPLKDHRLRRLIAQPNPATNEIEFLMLSVVHLDLAGNLYWLIVRGRDGLPSELWPLRPDLLRVLPSRRDPRIWSYGYITDPTSGVQGGPTDIIPVPRSDVIHMKYPNPLDMYFGQAPLRPATRAVAVDNGRTDFIDALLRNDAVPRVVVTTQSEIDETVVQRLEERWMRKYGGRGRGRPAFLQQGMDVKVLGLSLKDLEFGDMSGITEARICAAIGVQPILVGAKVGLDRSTFANFREAKVELWEDTLANLQDMFLAAVEHQLLPEFLGVGRQRIEVRWDKSEVLALQENESERWERAINALARGGITRNDFRRTVGLDPVPNGDVFLTPAGVVPERTGENVPAAAPAEATEQPAMLETASYATQFLATERRNGKDPVDAVARPT